MNKNRKDKLRTRAWKYALWAHNTLIDSVTGTSAHCYAAGYRAAMRDARKALYLHLRPLYSDDPIVQFLRPLR